MPMRGKLPIVTARPYPRASTAQIVWSCFLDIISSQELQCVVAFCTIGYLIAINMIIRFPDFGGTVAALATFP
jgi:hypothetical protein